MLFVEVTINQRQLSEMLVYTYPDGENTASQNFCLIYNEDFLNCIWAKDQTAPNEIQPFFLYKIK